MSGPMGAPMQGARRHMAKNPLEEGLNLAEDALEHNRRVIRSLRRKIEMLTEALEDVADTLETNNVTCVNTADLLKLLEETSNEDL